MLDQLHGHCVARKQERQTCGGGGGGGEQKGAVVWLWLGRSSMLMSRRSILAPHQKALLLCGDHTKSRKLCARSLARFCSKIGCGGFGELDAFGPKLSCQNGAILLRARHKSRSRKQIASKSAPQTLCLPPPLNAPKRRRRPLPSYNWPTLPKGQASARAWEATNLIRNKFFASSPFGRPGKIGLEIGR